MIGATIERGEIFTIVEIVKTVSVFVDKIAARFKFDAVLPGLGLGKCRM